MTRYNTPLPQNPLTAHPGTPHQAAGHSGQTTQGRPAARTPQPPTSPYPEQGWPAAQGGQRPAQRPAQAPYPDHSYGADAQQAPHDPYAALRPDGYGYAPAPQNAPDPYGLAGYTAPQPLAAQGYAPQAPQYAQPGYGAYANNGPQPGFPGQPSYGQAPASSFGNNGYALGQPAGQASQGDWGPQGLALDPRDYGPDFGGQGLVGSGQWGAGDPYAEHAGDPTLGAGPYQGQPAQQGAFDQSYAEDDAQYEDEPRRGGGWKKITALVACTVIVGGVLTVGYSSIMGTGTTGPTPLVKGAQGPSKVKPSEPGGKQFAYTDSKVMGRLGDGGDASAATPTEADASGIRKVPVVVVGRDGSIQPPTQVEQQEPAHAAVSVPGLTIDGFGGPRPSQAAPSQAASAQASSAAPQVQMVTASEPPRTASVPPSQKAKKAAELLAADDSSDATPAKVAAVTPKREKVAALAPAATVPAATGPQPTGAGYVAVLASVPASNSSRIDALKQFADMQQKYGTILQSKTPDVQEANLGAKGTYHRLLVGPPGSRDSASQVCTQLKASGYSGCWVTAY